MMLLTFEVLGTPAPQGSKAAVVGKDGRARLIEGRRRSGRDAHTAWRNAVALAARGQAELFELAAPLDCPLLLDVEFRFPMPKSRTKAVRESGHALKTTKPDLDKLLRTVSDALVDGGLIADDARVARMIASKHEVAGWLGATIHLREVAQ